jgi:hypothetical protein
VLASRKVTLVVAGEFYEPVEPLRARIAQLGLTERVRVLDRYVPDEEVGDLVAAADCVVLPYRSATQSGVVLVAYAGGCPVISTAVGGLPEVVDDGVTGFLVPPENPDALARRSCASSSAAGGRRSRPRSRARPRTSRGTRSSAGSSTWRNGCGGERRPPGRPPSRDRADVPLSSRARRPHHRERRVHDVPTRRVAGHARRGVGRGRQRRARPDGRLYPKAGIGQALAAAPFFALGKAAAIPFQGAKKELVTRAVTSLLNAFVSGLLGAILFLLFLEVGAAPRGALFWAFATCLATPLWVYAKSFLTEPLLALG